MYIYIHIYTGLEMLRLAGPVIIRRSFRLMYLPECPNDLEYRACRLEGLDGL